MKRPRLASEERQALRETAAEWNALIAGREGPALRAQFERERLYFGRRDEWRRSVGLLPPMVARPILTVI